MKNSMGTKRIISIILFLALMLSLSVTAFAETGEETDPESFVEEIIEVNEEQAEETVEQNGAEGEGAGNASQENSDEVSGTIDPVEAETLDKTTDWAVVLDSVAGQIKWRTVVGVGDRTVALYIYELKFVPEDKDGDGAISLGEYKQVQTTLASNSAFPVTATANYFADHTKDGYVRYRVKVSGMSVTYDDYDTGLANTLAEDVRKEGAKIEIWFTRKCQCGDPNCTCPGGCDCQPGCQCLDWLQEGKGCAAGHTASVEMDSYKRFQYSNAAYTDLNEVDYPGWEHGVYAFIEMKNFSCFSDTSKFISVKWTDSNGITWEKFYSVGTLSICKTDLPTGINLVFTPRMKSGNYFFYGWYTGSLSSERSVFLPGRKTLPTQHHLRGGTVEAASLSSDGSNAQVSLEKIMTAYIPNGTNEIKMNYLWTDIPDHSSEWVTVSYVIAKGSEMQSGNLSKTSELVHYKGSTVTNGSSRDYLIKDGYANSVTQQNGVYNVLGSKLPTAPTVNIKSKYASVTTVKWYLDSALTQEYKFNSSLANYSTGNFTIYGAIERTGYFINASAVNGTISPSGESTVTKGGTKTYTFTPDTGYSLDSVTVTKITYDNAGNEQRVPVIYQATDAAVSGGSFTFRSLDADYEIKAVFAGQYTVKNPVSGESFTEKTTGEPIDITSYVGEGYLYGGYFKNYSETAGYSEPYTTNGTSFVPVAGATYYVKEISAADYFKPRLLVTSMNDLRRAFLITVADSNQFNELGFTVDGTKSEATYATYTDLNFTKTSGEAVSYDVTTLRPAGSSITAGSIVTVELANYSSVEAASGSYSITPYYVTKDGVKVICPTTRSITPNGTVYPTVKDTVGGVEYNMTVTTAPTTASCITAYESFAPYATETAVALNPNSGAPVIPQVTEETEPVCETGAEAEENAGGWNSFFNNIGNALKGIFG